MKKNDEIICRESQPNVIIINGKPYIEKKGTTKILDHKLHGGDIIFVPYDEKKTLEDIDFIIDNIEELVDKREILREVLKKETLERIQKIKRMIERKTTVKRTRGCYGITIGDDSNGEYLQIA
jgi:hypothetical protein